MHRTVPLAQHGQIRLGSWRPLRAPQVVAALDGFVWAAATRVMGLPVTGFDRYAGSGRLASETVFVPAAGVVDPVRWLPVDERRATMLIPAGGHTHEVTVTVADSGALREVSMPRWAQHGRAEPDRTRPVPRGKPRYCASEQ